MLLNPALVRFGRAHAIGTLATVPLPGTPPTAGTAVAAKAVSYVCMTDDGYGRAPKRRSAARWRSSVVDALHPLPVHKRERKVPKRFQGIPQFFFRLRASMLGDPLRIRMTDGWVTWIRARFPWAGPDLSHSARGDVPPGLTPTPRVSFTS